MGLTQQEKFERVTVALPVAAVAHAASLEIPVLASVQPIWITDVEFIPSANVAADNTNFVTLALLNKGAAGTSNTVIASATTKVTAGAGVVGALTGFVPVQVGGEVPQTVTGTFNSGLLPTPNNYVAPGQAVSFKVTGAAAVVDLGAGTLVVQYSTSPALSNVQNLD